MLKKGVSVDSCLTASPFNPEGNAAGQKARNRNEKEVGREDVIKQ